MYITIPLAPRADSAAPDSLRQLLRAGATIEGIVHREDGGLVLRLGRLRVPVATRLPLQEGDRLRLRVAVTADTAHLEVVSRQSAPTRGDTDLARRLLPRQGDTAEPFRIALRAAGSDVVSSRLAPVRKLLALLLRQLPEPAELSRPEGLRLALRDSGVLYEWLLAAAPHAATRISASNVKATLLRLAAERQNAAPSSTSAPEPPASQVVDQHGLGEAVEKALSRIRLLQLQNARGDAGLDLAFEIPVRDGQHVDRIDLRLREDKPRQGDRADPAARLEVTARFHFDTEETLAARLVLVGEKVHVTWWTTSESLRRRVRDGLPSLADRLQTAGLQVGSVACRETSPPAPAHWPEAVAGGLVDDSA